jgi:hypothetical protein
MVDLKKSFLGIYRSHLKNTLIIISRIKWLTFTNSDKFYLKNINSTNIFLKIYINWLKPLAVAFCKKLNQKLYGFENY